MASRTEIIRAWGVHLYTASGIVVAAVMAWAIIRGGEGSFRLAIGMMILATLIDATDGTLARRWRVREILPGFDGRRLDDIVDYQTYTSLPILFIWRTGTVPDEYGWWLLVPLLASLYGFAQTEAKTADHFFLGFPSYWNVVAIYLYWFGLPVGWNIAIILILAILTFVPALYLYPSYRGQYSRLIRWSCLVWTILLTLIVLGLFENPGPAILASFSFPVLYMSLSWSITLHRWYGRS
ncbi:MAG: CDP-alcohol phosphatidyltransferase family protein [Acidobacteriota bacterium]